MRALSLSPSRSLTHSLTHTYARTKKKKKKKKKKKVWAATSAAAAGLGSCLEKDNETARNANRPAQKIKYDCNSSSSATARIRVCTLTDAETEPGGSAAMLKRTGLQHF